jgi:hypothetical protein
MVSAEEKGDRGDESVGRNTHNTITDQKQSPPGRGRSRSGQGDYHLVNGRCLNLGCTALVLVETAWGWLSDAGLPRLLHDRHVQIHEQVLNAGKSV